MKKLLTALIFCSMAYLNMFSQIDIGNWQFKNISSFEVEQDLTQISDKATIVLPKNYKQLDGKSARDLMKPGDVVVINAGYNNELFKEYRGYVTEISADIPVIITCDELYPLRQGNILKSYLSITLEALLKAHIKNYTIECPQVQLGKMFLENLTPYQMLEDLRKNFGLYTKVYGNKILHVGFAYDWKPNYNKRHTYTFASNVKSAKSLNYKRKDDFNTQVKVTIINTNGAKQSITTGSKNENAATNNIVVANKTTAEAKAIGDARLKQVSYDGFDGTILGFGYPLVNAGDTVEFISKKHPERNGAYLVEKVTKRYDKNGYEREVKPAFKVS